MKRTSMVLAMALGCAVALPAAAQQITGAGSTFVYPILSKWSEAYSQKTGARVNYQSIGSGGGIAQIKAATVDFGASDAPLPPDQTQGNRPRAVSARDRRDRSGRECRGRAARTSFVSAGHCSPTSIWARSRSGTTPRWPRSIPG